MGQREKTHSWASQRTSSGTPPCPPTTQGAALGLLFLLHEPQNHSHWQVIVKFTCGHSDFCHDLQGVECNQDSSCLQAGWDFVLILTVVVPLGQAWVAWGGMQVPGPSCPPSSGHQQEEPLCWRRSSLPLAAPGHATPGSSACPHALHPSSFRAGSLICRQEVCQHLAWSKWLFH